MNTNSFSIIHVREPCSLKRAFEFFSHISNKEANNKRKKYRFDWNNDNGCDCMTCGWHKHIFPYSIFHEMGTITSIFASYRTRCGRLVNSLATTWIHTIRFLFIAQICRVSSTETLNFHHRIESSLFSIVVRNIVAVVQIKVFSPFSASHCFFVHSFVRFGFDARRACAQLNFFDFNWRQ